MMVAEATTAEAMVAMVAEAISYDFNACGSSVH